MINLQGKVAIVTGGSRGIGRAIALQLGRLGADIVFTGRSINDNTRSLEAELQALGVRAKAYATDAADFAAAHDFITAVLQEMGRIDILVNNAGVTRDSLMMRMSEEMWDEVLTTNLKSVFNLSHAVTPHMMRARQGAIINISSVVGVTGNAGQANYAASKAGVIGLTQSLAKELGGRGVRVNAIAPGYIETDMTATLDANAVAEWTKSIPLKRGGKPEDVAAAVAFLASDSASYITGQVLHVCGGMVI